MCAPVSCQLFDFKVIQRELSSVLPRSCPGGQRVKYFLMWAFWVKLPLNFVGPFLKNTVVQSATHISMIWATCQMPFKCQGHPVSLWRWPLNCNLEKCYSLRSSFGMYNLERRLRYLHLLTRHCPCNLLPEPTTPKHEYRGKFWGHPVTSSMMFSPWNFFWHNLRCVFLYIWGQNEAVFNISKFSKWPPFWARDKLF